MTDLAPLPPSMTGAELIVYVNGIIERMNTVGGTDMPPIPVPSPWDAVRPAIDAIEDRLARWEQLGGLTASADRGVLTITAPTLTVNRGVVTITIGE